LLAAGVLGLVFSLGQHRNVMPIAIRVASYLGAYWVGWALFNALLAFLCGLGWDSISLVGQPWRLNREESFLILMAGANLPLLGFYLRRMTVVLRAARYATT